MSLLDIVDLHTHFVTRDLGNTIRAARALNGLSFTLERGKILGLVGESGAGKSLAALSIMRLLRPPARIVGGKIMLEGRDLAAMPEPEVNALRGDVMALVTQSPRSALDPLTRIGDQLVRAHRAHRRVGRDAALGRAREMLESVGIPDARRRLRAWPHELSGGMAQRVLIALALINQPRLLIADEPTTGLDVTVQARILDLLRDTARRQSLGVIIITHDLGVVAHYCEEVLVMFAGTIVESGPVDSVFAAPGHPYTQNLLAATPERLKLGSGHGLGAAPPDLYALPSGCVYRDRCPRAQAICEDAPPPRRFIGQNHAAACHFAEAAG